MLVGELVFFLATTPGKTQGALLRPGLSAAGRVLSLLLLLFTPLPGYSMDGATASGTRSVRIGERLSDWLLRQAEVDRGFEPGLMWMAPSQTLAQSSLQRELLVDFFPGDTGAPSQEVRKQFFDWLGRLPVTGRVPVAISDPRWLQAHQASDPVLDHGHSLRLVRRPATVTVVSSTGALCHIQHRSGAEASAYLNSCSPDELAAADMVWVIQPDGRIQTNGIASWNRTRQDEPAPGAWLWAPPRGVDWAARVSPRLAAFLATQGPSGTDLTILPRPAPIAEHRSNSANYSANDWGLIGLLQTPTARMAAEGDMRFHFSSVYPYGRGSVVLQPVDWLETGFRYTNISNRLYGPTIAGDQSLKDKSIDFKLRLMRESAYLPEMAVGITDIGGTGLFSGEYVVANKRTGDFDWSLGLGWGYVGARGNLRNPLSVFGKSFDARSSANNPSGGTVNSQSLFRGPTALFGGVQWQTPWEDLTLKAEYDGNKYGREPSDNNQPQNLPINIGLVYRLNSGVNLTLGFERGNTLMAGFTLHGGLDKLFVPKLSDPRMPVVSPNRPAGEPDWGMTATELEAHTLWKVKQIERHGSELRVSFEDNGGIYWVGRLDRVAAVLHRDAPADIDRFLVLHLERGIPMTSHRIDRDQWVSRQTRHLALRSDDRGIDALEPGSSFRTGHTVFGRPASGWNIGVAPSYSQHIGGPDGFILFQAGVMTPFEFRFNDFNWVAGNINARLVDNYSKFKFTGASNLPRVRTFMREYYTSSPITMPTLQANHTGRIGSDQYYSLYAGYLERMFAGVGAEWLYRPWHGPVAFGVDINRVRQRGFDQNLDLQDYRVTTGHATAYWDTRWEGIQLKLSAGQYLAGDRGLTLEVSRTFANGVSVGAHVTRTNVSAAEFGEGSFDKGIYVSIPFDAMLVRSSPQVGSFLWTPLTRDGGARLDRATSLYELTNSRGRNSTSAMPPSASAAGSNGYYRAERPSTGTSEGPAALIGEVAHSATDLVSGIGAISPMQALLAGGGAILLSSAFDRSADRWALNHASKKWRNLSQATDAVPLVLGLGTGLLWTGLAGEYAADTAWTALQATAFTLVAQAGVEYAVGRAKPEENLGPRRFNGGRSGALNSSFPSTHTGVAFALVTPFAQRFDAPWLYALAATTAFGRVQQRKHFLSDTVAGGLIGYGIATIMNENSRKRRNSPAFGVGLDRSVSVAWDF